MNGVFFLAKYTGPIIELVNVSQSAVALNVYASSWWSKVGREEVERVFLFRLFVFLPEQYLYGQRPVGEDR